MRKFKARPFILLLATLVGVPCLVLAQTSPNWKQGYIPSTAEWNQLWASKQDLLGSNGTVDIEHGGTSATDALDARTNLQVPGLGDNNLLTGNNTFVDSLICFEADCADQFNTGGKIQWDDVNTFHFQYHVGNIQHKALIDAAGASFDTPLSIANGGTGGSTPLNALNALGTYPFYISSQFNKTNTTSSVVTGSSLGLAASGVYYFRAATFITGDATGGVKIRMGTPDTLTINSISYRSTLTCISSGVNVSQAIETDITTNLSYSAGCTSLYSTIEGVIQANAAGTLGLFFAQSSASGTSSVLVNSSIQYQKEN